MRSSLTRYEEVLGNRYLAANPRMRDQCLMTYGREGAAYYAAFRADMAVASGIALLGAVMVFITYGHGSRAIIAWVIVSVSFIPMTVGRRRLTTARRLGSERRNSPE
jgi:hypothetical protein